MKKRGRSWLAVVAWNYDGTRRGASYQLLSTCNYFVTKKEGKHKSDPVIARDVCQCNSIEKGRARVEKSEQNKNTQINNFKSLFQMVYYILETNDIHFREMELKKWGQFSGNSIFCKYPLR